MSSGVNGGRPPLHASSSQQPPIAGKRPRPDDGIANCYLFKSQLQEYAQKAGVPTPVYETSKEGPSHAPFFRSTVIVNDVRYDSLPGFMNRKAAEQSAAEVALVEIAKSGDANATISQPVHGTGLCKNLLQEYAQKMNFAVPLYHCQQNETQNQNRRRGHSFQCSVDIGGTRYIGAVANTKKEAEIKAARTAWFAIKEISMDISGGPTGNSSLTVIPSRNRVLEPLNVPKETATPPTAKKGRHKKKMMKRKRNRKPKNALGEHSSVDNPAGADQTDLEVQHASMVDTEVPKSAVSEHITNNCETTDDQQGSECKRIRVSEPEAEGMKGVTGESVVEGIKGAIGESKVEGVAEGMSGAVGEIVVGGGNGRMEGAPGESEVEAVEDKRMEDATGEIKVEGVDEGMRDAIGEIVVGGGNEKIEGAIRESEVEGVGKQMEGGIGESRVEGEDEGTRGVMGEIVVGGGNERMEGAIGERKVEVVEDKQMEDAIGGSTVEGVDEGMRDAIGEIVVGGGNARMEGDIGEIVVEGVDKRTEGAIGGSKVEGVDKRTEGATGGSEVEGVDKRTEGATGGIEVEGVDKRKEGSIGESKVEGVDDVMEGALEGSEVEGVPGGSIVEIAKGALSESVAEGVETAPGAPNECVKHSNPTPETHPEPVSQTCSAVAVEGEGGVLSAVEIPAPTSNKDTATVASRVISSKAGDVIEDVGVAGGSDDGHSSVCSAGNSST